MYSSLIWIYFLYYIYSFIKKFFYLLFTGFPLVVSVSDQETFFNFLHNEGHELKGVYRFTKYILIYTSISTLLIQYRLYILLNRYNYNLYNKRTINTNYYQYRIKT